MISDDLTVLACPCLLALLPCTMSCEESLTLLVGGALGEGRRGLSKDGLPIRVWMGREDGAVLVLVNRREMKNDE